MINPTRFFLLSLVSWSPCLPVSATIVYTNHFRDWYPQYSNMFTRIRDEECRAAYDTYLTGDKGSVPIDTTTGGGPNTVLTQPVINCLLNHTSEYVKNGMTSAQVLLGVLPSVLSVLSASVEEMSTLAIVARRPLLALLLSAGSPSVYFSRAFEYHDVVEILQVRDGRLRQWRPSRRRTQMLVSGVEYVVALAATANIVCMNWELGLRTVCSNWTDGIVAPTLWACLGVFLHVCGAFVLRLRVCAWRGLPGEVRERAEVKKQEVQHMQRGDIRVVHRWFRELPRRLREMVTKTEFVPSAACQYDARLLRSAENKTFLVASWLVSVATIAHVIFGTQIFSSITFIGSQDASVIVVRYVGSVALCRVVLMYELAGIREACVRPIILVDRGEVVVDDKTGVGGGMSS
ncbi:hypothetical protein QBC34DRAFT_488660 [Podospora aff. communis PSN243]|uniref:Uncharacterized protein n=1 Tax=Podospora aff. communis PSN243 TaxID=3040156 RepID=A0AAV9G694_9PEZI|nr:hypothetical protein QBC34DRAFT_488660 [Podospora aff. communis PSN243]